MTQKYPLLSIPSVIDEFINNAFENFNFSMTGPGYRNRILGCEFSDYPTYPVSNIGVEENGSFFCEIGVPGFDESEIDVEIVENKLNIKGKHKTSNVEQDRVYVVRKLALRDFNISLPLSQKFDFDKVECKLEDGILYIDIPLKEEVKKAKEPRKILINNIQKAKEIS